MSVFTPSHLGKWEKLYRTLIEGESWPLTENMVWMLGNKSGIIAVLHENEPIHLEASKDIAKTIGEYLNPASNCDFRMQVAITDLGASPRTVADRIKTDPLSARVNRALGNMRFNIVPATPAQAERLADAFIVVADPRLSGFTARANAVIDALPKR